MSTRPAEHPLLRMPGRRGLVLLAAGALGTIALLYVVVPAFAGLDETWARLSSGDPVWLLAALLLEILSFGCYVMFFRAVFNGRSARIDWRTSYLITLAGVVATRVLAVGGAGGIALTAWALRRHGFRGSQVAADMAVFYVLLYGIYMACLVGVGLGLYSGVLPGAGPRGLTLVPAIFGATVIVTVLVISAVSEELEQVLGKGIGGVSSTHAVRRTLFAIPSTIASGVKGSVALLREPRLGLLGGLGWWAFDISVLWGSLEAFGTAPPAAVVVMAYFVGMLANALPIPGGIGAVDGGMIAALIGFGVSGGLAIVAVLTYRAFAFWLPIVPGVIAYVQLLRAPARVSAGGLERPSPAIPDP